MAQLAVKGSSFPVSPVTNDIFYRTDLDTWFEYVGSAWVNTNSSYSGTAFPTDTDILYQGMPFHRTDIFGGLDCFYDLSNTRWLSSQVFTGQFKPANVTTTINQFFRTFTGGYDIYINGDIFVSTVVASNDGSNYYSVILKSTNATWGSDVNLLSFNTSGDSTNATNHDGTTLDALPSVSGGVEMSVTVTGSPGTMVIAFGFPYRLIIT